MITKIINSAKKINPFGGLFFVINDLKNKGLAKLIDYHLGKRVKQARYSYSDIILNWAYCNLCGGRQNAYRITPKGRVYYSSSSWSRLSDNQRITIIGITTSSILVLLGFYLRHIHYI